MLLFTRRCKKQQYYYVNVTKEKNNLSKHDTTFANITTKNLSGSVILNLANMIPFKEKSCIGEARSASLISKFIFSQL